MQQVLECQESGLPRRGVAAGAAVQLNDRCPDPDARDQVLASARKVCVIIWTMVAGLFGFGFLGFVALVLFFLLLAMRKLRGGLTLGTSPVGVYVETFAPASRGQASSSSTSVIAKSRSPAGK
jgi:hypothetical protein